MLELLIAALVSGGVISLLFQLFKQGTAWVSSLSATKMRLILAVCSVLITMLGSVMQQDLPTDPSTWTLETFTAVATFAASQGWFLVKKMTTKS